MNICWICRDNIANTREHRTKRSDLVLELGTVSQQKPLFFTDVKARNIPIKSFDAKRLKYPHNICHACNTTLTQPHDKDWERLLKYLKEHPSKKTITISSVFPKKSQQSALNIHLYFLKLAGCFLQSCIGKQAAHGRHRINAIEIERILQEYADCIKNKKWHPNLYLYFGLTNNRELSKMVGFSHLYWKRVREEFECYIFFYYVGNFSIGVVYDSLGNKHKKKSPWHKDYNSKKITINDFKTDGRDKIFRLAYPEGFEPPT